MCTVSTKRTLFDAIVITSECVRQPCPKKRTPRNSAPSVTPVAANTMLRPGRQIAGRVNAARIANAHGQDPLLEFRSIHHQSPDHRPVQTADGRGRDHPLRSAARSHYRVDARAAHGNGNAGRKIPIGNEPDARARGANLLDQLRVPRPVQHHNDKVLHAAIHATGDLFEIFLDGRIQIE